MAKKELKLHAVVAPTEILVRGNTLQLEDYSKLDWEWSYFDPEEKKRGHEAVFPQECRKAHDMGVALILVLHSKYGRSRRKSCRLFGKTSKRAHLFDWYVMSIFLILWSFTMMRRIWVP